MARLLGATRTHVLLLILLVGGFMLAAPHTIAATNPITERSSVWGDWQSADFGPFETSLNGTPDWTASGLPANTRVNFGNNPGSTVLATVEQVPGTRGPDVKRDQADDVIPYDIVFTATVGNDTETFPVTFTLNPRPATITGSFEVSDRVYNGTTTATISPTNNTLGLQVFDPNVDLLSGVIGSDVTLSPVANFTSSTVGTQSATLSSSTLTGPEVGNYELSFTGAPTATAEITQKELSLVFQTVSKTYDGNESATVAEPTLQGIEGSDTVSVTGSPVWEFADKNVGQGKPLSISSGSYSLTGSAAANYSIPTPTLTGSISQRTLIVVAAATAKEYDGSNTAVLTRSNDDRVSGDSITVSVADGTFAQTTSGLSIAVTPGTVTLSGTDAGNYTATLQAGITGDITPKILTISGSFTVTAKTYDAGVSASGDVSGLGLDGVVGQETVSLTNVSLEYADADAGSHTVTIDSASLTGLHAGNYSVSLSGAPTATGTIDPLARTVTVSNTNKVYDGTTDATPTLTITRLGNDSVTVSGTAIYLDANVGIGITIDISGISLGGTDAGNYSVAPTGTATGNITTKTLTVTGLSGVNRVYDGTDSATVSGNESLVGVVTADVGDSPKVSLDTSGRQFAFSSRTAANNKAITASGYTLSGDSAANYSLTQPAGLTANISKATLTASITANDKTYDRSLTAVVTPSFSGKIGSDVVSLGTIGANNRTFDTRNQGTNKTVTAKNLTLTGADAGNYALASTTVTALATINPKQVTVTLLGKTYDGSQTGTAEFTLQGVISGDTFGASVSTTFPSANAGEYRVVDNQGATFDPANISISNNAQGNYQLVTPTSPVDGRIRKKSLTIGGTLTADDKSYDATNEATMSGSAALVGLVGNEQLTFSSVPPFTFSRHTVGTNLAVSSSQGFGITDGPNGELAANYSLTQRTFSADITPRELTIGGTFTVSDKEYNRNIAVSDASRNISNLTLVGVQESDGVRLDTVVLAFDQAVVGPRTISITQSTTFVTNPTNLRVNYTLNVAGAPQASASITPKPITASVSASNKTYDASDSVSATLSLSGVISGDTNNVTVSGTSKFADKNVGPKTVTASSLTLSGSRSANYALTSTTATTTASIFQKPITIDPNSVSANNKVYDQSTTASVTIAPGGPTLVGVLSADVVTVVDQPRTHTFSNRNAENGKSVTATGYAVDGTDAGNYSLSQPNFLRADITKKPVTASVSVTDKVYDATDSVNATLSLSGIIDGDTVTVSGPSKFADKNVGSKTVTASSLSLGGTHHNNYELTSTTATTTAHINPFRLTVTPSATNRQYDGTTTASASCAINKIGSDVVTIDCQNAVFASKNVNGTSTTPDPVVVTISQVSLSGADAGNYLLPLDTDQVSEKTQYKTSARILRRELKASGFTANPKDYDGTTTATFNVGNLALEPVVAGGLGIVQNDDVTFTNPAGRFDSRNAGTHNVRLQTWTLSGNDQNNYTVSVQASLTQAEIRPIDLAVTITAANKTYNGNTNASVSAQIDSTGLVPGDTTANISVSTPTGTFADKNVGTGKTVTINSQTVTFSGSLAGNYSPVFTNPAATINPRPLVWTVSATSRVYDGTTDVVYTLTNNRVSGDTFTVNPGSGSFSTPGRGNAKTVSVSGIGISGGDSGNYTAPSTAQGVANITPRAIAVTGTFIAADKTYDRTTTATVTSVSGLVLGNVVSADAAGISVSSTTAVFQSRNVGQDIDVTLTSASITGTNSSNYTVNVSGVQKATATINPRPVTPVVVVANRLWDGTANATVSSITRTPLPGDSLTLSSTGATFDSPDQGTNKTVTVSGITASNSNYSVPSTVTTTADITGTPVTVIASASNKTYGGSRNATVVLAESDSAQGDDLTLSFTQALFAQSGAGDGITVTVSGITLGGADAAAYVLVNSTATTTADIDEIVLSVSAADKVYDGTDLAAVSLSGVLPGDSVEFSSTPQATFDDPSGPERAKDVGVNKSVTVSGISLAGADHQNYATNSTETTSATITTRLLSPIFSPSTSVDEPATAVAVTDTDDRITGDDVVVNYSGSEAIRRGNQLILVVSGLTLTGTDAGNYRVVDPFEAVLRTFAPPPSPVVPPAPDGVVPQPVTPRQTPSPRALQGEESGADATPESSGQVSPSSSVARPLIEAFPGWRPLTAPGGTVDYGSGVTPRNSDLTSIVAQIAVVPRSLLSQTTLEGFSPGAVTFVEAMGAQTFATVTITAEDGTSAGVLRAKLANVFAGSGAITGVLSDTVEILSPPFGLESTVSAPDREALSQALSWVGLPAPTRGVGFSTGDPVALFRANVEGFVPGSAVFLVATSEPALIAWGEADSDGRATLKGTVLTDTFSEGSHRIRVIGTRALDSQAATHGGSASLDLLVGPVLETYDSDTRLVVGVRGENSLGADHVSVRFIDLTSPGGYPVTWGWLLLPLVGVALALLMRIRRHHMRLGTRFSIAALTALLAAPAVIMGLTAASQLLTTAGLIFALLLPVVSWRVSAVRSRKN